MKNIIIIAVAVAVLLAGGAYLLMSEKSQLVENTVPTTVEEEVVSTPVAETSTEPNPEPTTPSKKEPTTVIGQSAGNNDITAYHFGNGEDEILLIGGIHGGYSWNTSLLAFELIDWLEENQNLIPDSVTVTVIPVLNPDGLELVTGTTGLFNANALIGKSDATRVAGRFNSNEVDINRNFACEWESVGTWQNRSVSGGDAPFSEPESSAVRDYVQAHTPSAVVTWYSAAGGVYASSCNNGISAETRQLTNLFADAAGYTAYEEFDYYEITGDMVNWFASENIPAISVLLTNHTDTEFAKNRAGLEALLNTYR